MLTVLWRHKDGAEEIFTAERVIRMNVPDQESVPALGSFVAHGVDMPGTPADYFQFDIAAPFGAVFVMNEKGRTVATYFAEPLRAAA